MGSKHFSYGVNTATCLVEESQYDYKPKSGSDVYARPLIDHLKRKHPNPYSKTIEEEKKTKPKAQI